MADHATPKSVPLDSSDLNPHAAARRRLLKAVGLGVGAGLISIDWAKPALRLGALPAHAQGSEVCGATWAISIVASGEIFSMSLGRDAETLVASTFENSGELELTDSDPNASHSYRVTFSRSVTGNLDGYSTGFTCCTAVSSSNFFPSVSSQAFTMGIGDFDGDGACTPVFT